MDTYKVLERNITKVPQFLMKCNTKLELLKTKVEYVRNNKLVKANRSRLIYTRLSSLKNQFTLSLTAYVVQSSYSFFERLRDFRFSVAPS